MKTPKEIEKLADEYVMQPKYDDKGHKGSFIKGYTKCQQDNIEKKYTIKEVEKYHDIRATQGISNANKYIESLNK